jgi:hypothetical protein
MLEVLNGPVIMAGESLSEALDVRAGQLVRITMPGEWTEAPLTFQFSTDGMFFNDMFGIDGFEVTVPVVVPGSGVIIPADVGRAMNYIKFRSGTRGNPVPQEKETWFAIAVVTESVPEAPPARSAAKKKAPSKKSAVKKKSKR